MAMIGHNSASLASAAEANVETGIWLLCKEFLVTAIQDRRLERGHLRVLACFAQLVNRVSGKAWPDRVTIAAMAGMTPKAVSTAISELKKFGYLISEREPVEMAGGQTLVVYTFGNIDHDTIRSEITAFVESLKQSREPEKTPPTGNSTATPYTGKDPVHGEQKTPQMGNNPADGELSTPPTGNSTPPIDNTKTTTSKKTTVGSRGSRLPADWRLPKSWGQWALNTFEVQAPAVRVAGESFGDYWRALSGSKGLKTDWEATWRNWCRRAGWKYRPGAVAADDLLAASERPKTVDDLYGGWRDQQ